MCHPISEMHTVGEGSGGNSLSLEVSLLSVFILGIYIKNLSVKQPDSDLASSDTLELCSNGSLSVNAMYFENTQKIMLCTG